MLRPLRSTSAILGTLVLVAAPGCRAVKALDVISIPEAKEWNLEQLHTPETEHRYSADLQGDITYLLRRMVSGIGPGDGFDVREGDPDAVRDPNRRCHGFLLELAEFDGGDPAILALQIEWGARLAAQDPWALSREAATLMLGDAGRRLGIELPAPPRPDVEPVGAEVLSELLARLVRTFRDDLARRDAEPLRLTEVCTELRALEYDIDAGRRALRTVRLLATAAGKRPAGVPLHELSRDLQVRLVHLGLAAAVADEAPVVRSAAVFASAKIAGPSVLAPYLANLDDERADEVVVAVLRLVAELGFPEPGPALEGDAYVAVREQWLRQLQFHAVQHREGHVRVNAMQALGRVADVELASLREEDWIRWWERRTAPAASETRGG